MPPTAEAEDYMAARRSANGRWRLQKEYLKRRPSQFRCMDRQRVPLSYYLCGGADRPSPREWKTDEARFSRRERRDLKRQQGHHLRRTWLAQGLRSLEWTTCGGWILGPPKGTWSQYPKSKGMRQREARQAKRKAKRAVG